jgi:hypothetical protein
MPTIDTLHPDAANMRATDDPAALPPAAAGTTAASVAPQPGAALTAFRAGRSEVERTADLLAFAIATERGLAPTPDGIERARREADAALGDYSLRYVHNTVEQIRQEAVVAHLGGLRQPPSFLGLLLANLAACAIAAAAGLWAWSRPEIRAAAARLLGN